MWPQCGSTWSPETQLLATAGRGRIRHLKSCIPARTTQRDMVIDMVIACHLRAKALYSAIENQRPWSVVSGREPGLTRLDRLQEGQSEARLRLITPPGWCV